MENRTITLKGYHDEKIFCRVWDDCKKPKGVLLIAHGMQEHSGRYDEFAQFLNKNNFIVYATDLRCHGKTCNDVSKLGHTDSDVFSEIVSDQIILIEKLATDYDLPIHVLGHSFGSFITQKTLQESTYWKSAILSGTAYTKTFSVRMGKVIADATARFKGKHANAKLVEAMTFRAYAKKFPPFGNWLSRDLEVCKKYKEDEFCGTPFPAGFYQSMFSNMLKIPSGFSKIPKDRAILIIAGGDDPVGSKGKLPKMLQKAFKKVGLDSTLKIFPGARHEVLNETNKVDVWNVVLDFLNKNKN